MLGKLAYRNAKRSIKDYLIYLITITLSFSLILAFNLVASSDEVAALSSGMSTFKNVLIFVNIVIVFVVCFLINYTTKFMFEKRSKEFGTYMLLGIKKTSIARLLVTENILVGIFAFILAIPIGFCIQSVYICNHRKTAQNTENNLHLCKLCVYRNAGCLLSADLPFSSSKSVKTNKENDCTRFSLL